MKIILIFLVLLSLKLHGQKFSLTIPENLKDEIYDFTLSKDNNNLIINNEFIINLKNLEVNYKNYELNKGSLSYFINNNEILTIGDLSNNDKLFLRSVEDNNLLSPDFFKIPSDDKQGTFYPINDSTFIIDFVSETLFFIKKKNSFELTNKTPHLQSYSNTQTRINYGVPLNKNKLSIVTFDQFAIYDCNSKKQLSLFKNYEEKFVYNLNKTYKISVSERFSKNNFYIMSEMLNNKSDTFKLPFKSMQASLIPVIINDSTLLIYNETPWDPKITTSDPFCLYIDLNSNKILKMIYIKSKVGELISMVNHFNNNSKNIFFSQEGKLLILDANSYLFSEIKLIDELYQMELFNGIFRGDYQFAIGNSIVSRIPQIQISKNDNILFLNYSEYISCYDLKSKKEVLQIYLLKDESALNSNILFKVPNSNYFSTTKAAVKKLHFVNDSDFIIGFDQLDPVYNRPDIVLDSLGKYLGESNQGMIKVYRNYWEKRIDRLGLDKEILGKGEIEVPSAEIVGADEIGYNKKEGNLNIKVSANDSKYHLQKFNVYVNEVPLYGSAGVSIANLKKQEWETNVSIPLSVGENKIQVSVMNELGLENFKYPTYVNYTPENKIEAKTHFIGIGVNEFNDASQNLTYCVKDVNDLAKEIVGKDTHIKIITNKNVTRENILKLKQYLIDSTTVNDKVIISCSSHGLLDDSLNFYLAMHDVDFNNPQTRGLKYEELESLLDGIPARQKLLLLDACNSGENYKTELLKQELKQKEKSMDSDQLLSARGGIIKLTKENKSNFKKMNELFVNVRNNTGSVIISAAGGQESALEAITVDGKTIENGAFTYSVLECLKQNEGKDLKVNTLKQYVEKRVEEITNASQKPTSRQETMDVDWNLR